MSITGELQPKKKLFLRKALGEGQIEGKEVEVSINIDGKAIIIRFPQTGSTVLYSTSEMVKDAYEICFPDEATTAKERIGKG